MKTNTSDKRWHVLATYAATPFDHIQESDIDELEELQDLVEKWPDWGTLSDIRITYNFHDAAKERRSSKAQPKDTLSNE